MVGKDVLTTVFSSATRSDVKPKPMIIDQNLSPRPCFRSPIASKLLLSAARPTASVGFSETFSTLSSLCALVVVVVILSGY